MKLTAGDNLSTFLRKGWMIMRITTLIILVTALHVCARSSAQSITLSSDGISMDELFNKLNQQTGYSFIVKSGIIPNGQTINIHVTNASLEEVLEKTLKPFSLSYKIDNKIVYILKSEVSIMQPVDSSDLPPSTVEIHGHVINAQGVPLGGANVVIQRTKKGTQTNVKGEFVLENVYPDDILTISFIGFKTKIIKVENGKEFPIVLEIATDELDKVVIQAYGTTTQRYATGNIKTVTSAEIERQPVMNPLDALYGKVPGLVITQTSGYASGPVNVEIRGRANISGIPSDPLFIIDGVPMSLNGTGNGNARGIIPFMSDGNVILGPAGGQSPLFSVNPADIESFTVLKDADATAIYGSRGANGVVIITTKKGKAGKTKWDVNVYQGVQKITNHYSLLNTQQYLAMRREAIKNDGIIPDGGNAYDLLTWDTTRYTDFQKFFWDGLGKETDVETGLSGGDKQTNFRISGGYHNQGSIFSYSGAEQRASLQFNLTHKSLNQRLLISFSNLYSYTQSDLIGLNGSVINAPNTPPIFDAANNLNYSGWIPISNSFPYASLLQPYQAKTGFLNSNLNLQYELVKGLNISTQVGYSTSHLSQINIQPISSYDPTTNPKGSSQFGNNNMTTTIIEPQLEYSGTLGKGQFNTLIGGSIQSTSADGNFISGSGYADDNLLHSIANAPIKNASDGSSEYKYAAVFGRVTYNWDGKYIFNLSARRDGSSRFGPGKQFGNFGSIGAAWIFTEEKWFKDHMSFLSFGKFRSSYGLTGSDQLPNYQYLTSWSGSVVIPYDGSPAYLPTQHANPSLQWQTNKKLEVAVNLGFLKDRLTIEIDWYRDLCGDELVQYTLPIITGFGGVYANFPATVENTGWESSFTAKIIRQKDLNWNFNFNIGINRNKLLAFPNLDQSPYFGTLVVGEPLNIKHVLHYTGVDPLTGTYTFLDKNKDGQIDQYVSDATNDLFIKDLSVQFDGGFGTDLQYKGWQLNLFFNFRKQQLPSAQFNGTPGQVNLNQSVNVLDHWQKPGDRAKFARYTTNPDQGFYNYTSSDGIYSDGSYIRLRNLSISYEFSEKWMKGAGFQKCILYLRGQNLFIITKYDGIDPDVSQLGVLPPSKVFTAGIQFTL